MLMVKVFPCACQESTGGRKQMLSTFRYCPIIYSDRLQKSMSMSQQKYMI
jgi:hypothetical protein